MKPIFTLFFCWITAGIFSQTPFIQWQKTYGGSNADNAESIQRTYDGGYIIAGNSRSTDINVTGNHGNYDVWVVKVDSAGHLLWEKSLGGNNIDVGLCIKQTPDSGYVVAGQTENPDLKSNGLVIKLDSIGNTEWQKEYGDSNYNVTRSIQPCFDGGYIVAGITEIKEDIVNDEGEYYYHWNVWALKLDSEGNIEWEKALGGLLEDAAYSVQQTFDSGYIIAGYTFSDDGDVSFNHGYNDVWLVKLNVAGDIAWEKTFGGTDAEFANSIRQTADSGYVFAGITASSNGDVTGIRGGVDGWIVKLNKQANIEWQKTYGGSLYDEFRGIELAPGGNYIACGQTQSSDGDVSGYQGNGDYWVIMIDDAGLLQWQKTLGGTGSEAAKAVELTSDGGFILTGTSNSVDGDKNVNYGESGDYWTVKLILAVQVTYIFTGNGNWNVPSNWLNNSMPPDTITAGQHIIIKPASNGICILDKPITILLGGKLTVDENAKFDIKQNIRLE